PHHPRGAPQHRELMTFHVDFHKADWWEIEAVQAPTRDYHFMGLQATKSIGWLDGGERFIRDPSIHRDRKCHVALTVRQGTRMNAHRGLVEFSREGTCLCRICFEGLTGFGEARHEVREVPCAFADVDSNTVRIAQMSSNLTFWITSPSSPHGSHRLANQGWQENLEAFEGFVSRHVLITP